MSLPPFSHLRPLTSNDFDAVHDYASDPEVVKKYHWGPNTEEETRAVMDWWASTEWPLVRAIINENDEVVGVCELREDGSVGYTIRRAFWGAGYASAALHALVEMARTLAMPLVWGSCREGNAASRAILSKEMTPDGTTRCIRGVEQIYFEKRLNSSD